MANTIHIGVDARPLSCPLTGIGQYTYQLLRRLLVMDARWTLYSDRPFIVELPQSDQVNFRIGNPIPRMSGGMWSQTILPFWIAKDKLDVFWSPRHHLPLFGNRSLPMVLTIHDLVYKLFSHTVKRSNLILESLLLPNSVKRANKIISVSHTTEQDLITHLQVPPEKITVIYPGLTLQEGLPASVEDLQQLGIHKEYILFLGTLEPRKNIARIIEAYQSLPENLRGRYQLVLAGGKGWGKSDYLDLIEKFSLRDQIILPGFVSESQRASLLNNATIFVMPSLYEGFGSPALEAMAAGIPLLTSDRGGNSEVAKDSAMLVDPYQVEAICDGMVKLLTDADLRSNLKKQGLIRAKAFTWDDGAKKILDLLQESL